MVFNFDWWFDKSYDERVTEARKRCAQSHFPQLKPNKVESDPEYKKFHDELETRTIVYLRDGFSYEIKEILRNPNTMTLTFECMAADEAYKVGCFVVTVPFEDIVRVEVFAVHPQEKPEDMPAIKGFAHPQASAPPVRGDDRSGRNEAAD
jgi:hypothetical protein